MFLGRSGIVEGLKMEDGEMTGWGMGG